MYHLGGKAETFTRKLQYANRERFKNEEGFKKHREIKMQSKLFYTHFDILALYTMLKMGLLNFCHDREDFLGEIPKMTTT